MHFGNAFVRKSKRVRIVALTLLVDRPQGRRERVQSGFVDGLLRLGSIARAARLSASTVLKFCEGDSRTLATAQLDLALNRPGWSGLAVMPKSGCSPGGLGQPHPVVFPYCISCGSPTCASGELLQAGCGPVNR